MLIIALSLSLGASALTLACSSEDGGSTADNDQTAPEEDAGPSKKDASEGTETPEPTKDAGKDASKPPVKDSGPSPEGLTESEVQDIFDSRCTSCHGSGAAGGLNLTDFTTSAIDVASTQVPALKRIEPGDKSKSYLFHKISGTHKSVGGSGDRMPKGGAALSKDQIDGIGAYIDGL